MTSTNKPGGLRGGLRGWLRRDRDGTDGSATAGTTAGGDDPQSGAESSTTGAPAEPTHVEIVELDDVSFDKGTEGGATVVDFWAAWCRPCTVFHPLFQHAADTHDGPVRFARCDVEGSPRTASMVGIQSIPTVALFDVDGNEVERLSGVPSRKELERLIDRGAALTAAP